MENPNAEPEQILLKDLPKEHYRLNFLTDVKSEHIKREMEVSIKAGELVGKIYDVLRKQYKDSDSLESLKSLNIRDRPLSSQRGFLQAVRRRGVLENEGRLDIRKYRPRRHNG